jgi:protein-S-isoprenylcysteine O-methyltransferase Ste14
MSSNINNQYKRKVKRVLALIFSGIYVLAVLPVIGILISLYLDSLLGWSEIILYPFNLIIAIIILVVGFFFAIWSNIEIFRTGKGSPVPLKGTHTTELVIKGPYKYSRNPMVFGYILFWIGLGFIVNSLFLAILFTGFITIVLILLVKLWEEKNMAKRFGKSYLEYKKRVSFLIPFPPKKIHQSEMLND